MNNIPMRIQRKRVKGWRRPENTKVVTRPGKYGNPFLITAKWGGHLVMDSRYNDPVGFFATSDGQDRATKCALDLYRLYLIEKYHAARANNSIEFTVFKQDLYGRNLACFCHLCDKHKDGRPLNESCPDCDPCHVDVLGELLYGVKE